MNKKYQSKLPFNRRFDSLSVRDSKSSAIVEGLLLLSSLTAASIISLLLMSKLLHIFSQAIVITTELLSFIVLILGSYTLISILFRRSPKQALKEVISAAISGGLSI